MAKSEFDIFIQEEVDKIKGVAIPVKCGVVERLATKKMLCSKMHPNPDDEFTFPDIGPNYEIVSNYVKDIKENQKHGLPPFEEPILVEKLHPHGYMIINGHHRWAAAVQMGIPKIHAAIVNPRYVPDYSSDSQTGGES